MTVTLDFEASGKEAKITQISFQSDLVSKSAKGIQKEEDPGKTLGVGVR